MSWLRNMVYPNPQLLGTYLIFTGEGLKTNQLLFKVRILSNPTSRYRRREQDVLVKAMKNCPLLILSVSGTQHRMKHSRVLQKTSRLGAMSALFKNIEEQARSFNAEDRAKLAESMLESLHTSITEIEAAWAEEIEERVSAFDRGEIPAYSAKEVFAEAHRNLQ